jgi:hypothetical protein
VGHLEFQVDTKKNCGGIYLKFKMAHSFFGRQPEIQDGPQFFFWCQPDIQDGLHYFLKLWAILNFRLTPKKTVGHLEFQVNTKNTHIWKRTIKGTFQSSPTT